MFPIVDAHCDTAFLLLNDKAFSYNFWKSNENGHIDYPRLVKGGIDVQFFAVCTEYVERKAEEDYNIACKMIKRLKGAFKENPGKLSLVTNNEELQEVLQRKKIATVLAMEGGAPLNSSLSRVELFYGLGIRVFGLTWNYGNCIADGIKVKNPRGLTSFGKDVVSKLNKLGVIIDCAHLAKKGFEDVANLSADPFIVSHANAYKICPHPRNLTDEQLKIISQKGGVVGISVYPEFVACSEASLEKLLDHFAYIADVAGVETVGFGSDFDGIHKTLEEIPDVSFYPRVIDGLKRRGFNNNELKLILGGNFLRVMKMVWSKES